MKQFTRVMKALSDPNRVKILKLLEDKEMCVCEIQELFDLAQPTISKHLKVLEDAELVDRKKQKLWVNYKIASAPASVYAQQLLKNLATWLNDDQEIQHLRSQAANIDRNFICNKKN